MMKGLPRLAEKLKEFSLDTIEQAEIQVKYEVYIEKEKELVQKMGQLEELLSLIILITIKFLLCQPKHFKNSKR